MDTSTPAEGWLQRFQDLARDMERARRAQREGAGASRARAGLSDRTAQLAGLHDPPVERAPAAAALGVEALDSRLDWSDPMAVLRLAGVDGDADAARTAYRGAVEHLLRGAPREAERLADAAIDQRGGALTGAMTFRFHLLRGLLRLVGDAGAAYSDLAAAADAAWGELDRLHGEDASTDRLDRAEIGYLCAELTAAWAALLSGDAHRAREHAACAITHHPGLGRAHYLDAKARIALGEAELALASVRRAICADEGFAPIIAADPEFHPHDAALGDVLAAICAETEALAERFDAARRLVVTAIDDGPITPPKGLLRAVSAGEAELSVPARLRRVKRSVSNLWRFMADFEVMLLDRTPALTAKLERRRGQRGVTRRRLAKRALILAAFSVLSGGLLARAVASAFVWLEPEMFPGAANVGYALALAAAMALSVRIWRRMRRNDEADAPLSRSREWALKACAELNRAFDELNGALKNPRHAAYFPDTAAMFRVHLGGPTLIDGAEGRLDDA